ncbi:MAG: nitroreductase [Cryomorphaceae bacterium]|jgi:nitroreductase|nr:nitroreductase [Cryomorphaceae bacterium]MDC1010618.1 nitroreductase [Flavobacteriaceae bacterium]MDG1246836.1 nitroreductase [Flavobacteriaceae bacterium]
METRDRAINTIMNKETLNSIIRNRKSIYPNDYTGDEIPDNLIREILLNANHAPTHRMTQPWFFKVYKNESKQKLIDIVSKIDDSKISKIKLDKFIQKINDSNTVISIFLNRDKKERLPEWEEIAAVSMAVQNMWLTCYVNNIGSYWSTPGFIHEYGNLIKLDNNQSSLGFFFMGVYDHKESPKLRDDINTKVEWQ